MHIVGIEDADYKDEKVRRQQRFASALACTLCPLEAPHSLAPAVVVLQIEWWRSVYGFNMSCIRDLAMLEPLVDTVQAAAINTTTAQIHVRDDDAGAVTPSQLRRPASAAAGVPVTSACLPPLHTCTPGCRRSTSRQ